MTQRIDTVVIFGKKGQLIVNESDLPEWKKKGYKTETELKIAEANKPAKKGKKDADASEGDDAGEQSDETPKE